MTNEDNRRELYLANAKTAEENAARAKDAAAREAWLRIAEAYRDLAKSRSPTVTV